MSKKNFKLWEVHFMSSYDDDGVVPVDARFFVLAEDHDQAIEKSEPLLKSLKKKYKDHKIEARPVPMEILIVARDSSNDGRIGWHSTDNLREVSLSLEEDIKAYKLEVCLTKK